MLSCRIYDFISFECVQIFIVHFLSIIYFQAMLDLASIVNVSFFKVFFSKLLLFYFPKGLEDPNSQFLKNGRRIFDATFCSRKWQKQRAILHTK